MSKKLRCVICGKRMDHDCQYYCQNMDCPMYCAGIGKTEAKALDKKRREVKSLYRRLPWSMNDVFGRPEDMKKIAKLTRKLEKATRKLEKMEAN